MVLGMHKNSARKLLNIARVILTDLIFPETKTKKSFYERVSSIWTGCCDRRLPLDICVCLEMIIPWEIYGDNFVTNSNDWYSSAFSIKIALVWMPHEFTNDRSALVQVMAWCRQAQAITWTNVDQVLCRCIASLGSGEFKKIPACVSVGILCGCHVAVTLMKPCKLN